MIFTTYWFLAFALLVIVVFRWLPTPKARLVWLGLGCVLFHYHFAGPAGVLPIIVLMVVTFAAGRTRNPLACVAAMVACGLALCFYKYVFFLIGAAVAPISAGLATRFAKDAQSVMPGAPPLGISFFAFEFVHYLEEVRRGGEPIRNPLKFLLFAIFFPSLVAGPIKRYSQFLPSLDQAAHQTAPAADVATGVARMALGYFKKVLIADTCTAYIDHNQPSFAAASLWGRWLILALIAVRILMDFSGYSDIAIGCAQTMGIRLPENFYWPYAARNLREFWQRWHMSLTSWIRDYIYIPLGGNRHGVARRALNGLIAFALCGLWHGPAWNFVAWGVYHGAGLAVCSTYRRVPVAGPVLGALFGKEPVVAWLLTLLFTWLGWLLFFYPVSDAWNMARLLFVR